jgi:hypothetical protein
MARSEQFTLKIRLSRSERRLLTRAAKAAHAPTLSGWVRALGLKAAHGEAKPSKPPVARSNEPQGASHPLEPPRANRPELTYVADKD